MRWRWAIAGMVVCGLAGCGGKSAPVPSTTTLAVQRPAASTSSTAGGGDTSTAAPASAQNLPVSAAVRQSLLAAGAAYQSLPTSDYTGLRPGATYYAYDPATSTYWAGAALDPSPSSQQAQVSSQDDGSYLLFQMRSGRPWTVYDDGLGGIGGTPCPVTIPPAVVAVWGWSPGACLPPNR